MSGRFVAFVLATLLPTSAGSAAAQSRAEAPDDTEATGSLDASADAGPDAMEATDSPIASASPEASPDASPDAGPDDTVATGNSSASPDASDATALDVMEAGEDARQVTIVGNRARRNRVAGSAHRIDEEQLSRMEYDDAHRVLAQVPGVYTRDEDGFGLRPNIGLRGANSDRSSKVTLLEDGILMAPAPYAAPAAYYFPLATRLVGVEVFKGPASIKNGPQTVGGAVHLQTRRVPYGFDAGVDLSTGAFGSSKGHAFVGYGTEHAGFVLEGAHVGSAGFKELDGGGPTGFSRQDLMFKGRLSTGESEALSQTLELKLSYSGEDSNETYLGLGDADFAATPYRRYAASALDHMAWQRLQGQLGYTLVLGESDLDVIAYRHDLSRAWRKFNRMGSSLPVAQVLANPTLGQSAVLYQVLSGQKDSESDDERLLIGTNDRRFYAQGLQARARTRLAGAGAQHRLEAGVRVHEDQIARLHDEFDHDMRAGRPVKIEDTRAILADNTGTARALALYLSDEIEMGPALLTPGLRYELIHTEFHDRASDEVRTALQQAWMPGVGLSVQALPALHLLAGVHKGFSPVSPGQPEGVRPEESWNYEAGGRVAAQNTRGELIGFFSQYANLTGECTFSQGCIDDTLNRQYNAGEVWVYGLEAGFGHTEALGPVQISAEASYTLTLSRFLTSFRSENPLFGNVDAGDELPYVPVHRGAGQLVIAVPERLEAVLSTAYTSAMRDQASQGAMDPAGSTQEAWIVDAGLSLFVAKGSRLYLRTDNLTQQDYIASRRPFGARPGKPFSWMVGYQHRFE